MTERKEARKLGKKRYIGNPCDKLHTERYTSSGQCVECDKLAAKNKWKAKKRQREKNEY